MKFLQSRFPFLIIFLLAIISLIVAVWDLLNENKLYLQIYAAFGILIFLSIILISYKHFQKPFRVDQKTVTEFEKSLKGRLTHFKCSNCYGVFAIKKSKRNNKKEVKLTCPDCGTVGVIPAKPKVIQEVIPEQKSSSVRFQCDNCNEWLTLWAEGSKLYDQIKIQSCPYCGVKRNLHKV